MMPHNQANTMYAPRRGLIATIRPATISVTPTAIMSPWDPIGERRAIHGASVVRQKSLSFDCHSGLDPESSLSELDSRFRGNDGSEMNVKKR
jgi:hypothetical protein